MPVGEQTSFDGRQSRGTAGELHAQASAALRSGDDCTGATFRSQEALPERRSVRPEVSERRRGSRYRVSSLHSRTTAIPPCWAEVATTVELELATISM